LQLLWAHDISSELAKDARSPEDLLSKYRDEHYSWIIVIKQDSMLKIKSMGRRDMPDADIPSSQLLSWMRAEIRERDSKNIFKLRGHGQTAESSGLTDREHEQDVKVLVSQHRSKKFNRRTVVEQAHASAAKLVETFLDGPIVAIETTDEVMNRVQRTPLSDPESWRDTEHSVSNVEKKYIRELHDLLDTMRHNYEQKKGAGSRHSFLYNFRTGNCVYYDLGA
jgi:translation initiation factor 2-alpha kinase 4